MIFVVDDDGAARDSIRFLLETNGIDVVDFASAEAFLDAYRRENADCLILDMRMPGMSGLELLERLRRGGSDDAAIIVSGLHSAALKQRAERAGARYLEKPFSGTSLIDAVRQSLAGAVPKKRKEDGSL